ncbi:hypothetical protein SXCC_04710 [Gluconacetobacter sp. SXCC-1]|nr:hypothetical protein SXCC_04710 [Gluconacetobacter sp. SXCC-1]
MRGRNAKRCNHKVADKIQQFSLHSILTRTLSWKDIALSYFLLW